MVIPGFLATDFSTVILRRTLEAAGYRVYGWGLGLNLGARKDLLERLEEQLGRAARHGPVSLVGWSLGGLYARELAKLRPSKVARVITLGSPFSGDARANNAWRLYEMINDHKVDFAADRGSHARKAAGSDDRFLVAPGWGGRARLRARPAG
jgi:pimeloyl-ACP methyl ester carboxylesterase